MVIPTFNSAPFIAEAIQSVQEQTYVNGKLYEVDGKHGWDCRNYL
jgi:glycosyltransferase involved in cell wall biosynthesis